MPGRPRPPRYAVVASRFNGEITRRLVEGAVSFLRGKGLAASQVEVHWTPGAFELPVAALRLARCGRFAAIVAVGCVLEGETPHFRYLSQATLQGLTLAAVLSGVPVTCGVVTARSWGLALARSRLRGLNRGREAAEAAWELVEALRAARA